MARRITVGAGWLVALLLTAWTLGRAPAGDQARLAFDRGDWLTAASRAADQLDRRPDHAPSAQIAARALSRRGRPDLAEGFYRRAGTLSDAAWADRIEGGEAVKDWPAVIATASERTALVADDEAALRALGRAHDALKSIAELDDVGARLVALGDPANVAWGASFQAIADRHRFDHKGALANWSRAIEADPDLIALGPRATAAFRDAADSAMELGQPTLARSWLQRATTRLAEPGLIDLLGVAALQQRDVPAARAAWHRSRDRDPSRATPWFHLGTLAYREGHLEEAIECLEAADARVPRHLGTNYHLSLCYRQAGRPAEAAERARLTAELRRGAGAPAGGMGAGAAATPP